MAMRKKEIVESSPGVISDLTDQEVTPYPSPDRRGSAGKIRELTKGAAAEIVDEVVPELRVGHPKNQKKTGAFEYAPQGGVSCTFEITAPEIVHAAAKKLADLVLKKAHAEISSMGETRPSLSVRHSDRGHGPSIVLSSNIPGFEAIFKPLLNTELKNLFALALHKNPNKVDVSIIKDEPIPRGKIRKSKGWTTS